jgi:uncharacterized membrane protein YcaP (DUF421 family)
MAGLGTPEWAEVFAPDRSLFESFLRGTVVYFTVLVLVRVFPKRQIGSVGLTDVLLLVLLSECVSQALNANSLSVANGAAAVAALLFWNFFLDWLSYRWRWLQRILEHEPVKLVEDGRPIPENLRNERLTDEELRTQLRLKGIDDVSRVKKVMIEPEGKLSVIPKDPVAAVAPGAGATPDADQEPADFDSCMRRFLAAAQSLRSCVDWHEGQAAEHRKAAKEAREALARHGLRGRKVFEALAHPAPEDSPPGRNGRHATTLLVDDEDKPA